ncbi:ArsC family protein [Dokdonia sp. MED134]|uniref:arsenate reductase (glutaredoxin) n=1 Tax=Dokdonia sp. MED134 TaxID=313590 RepID=UPI000068ABFB|nr:arsenate reductase (glutaredoxin) [Dokdonia sp. MED134]EAQ39959.1 ArsC family protein [Dokdonia sp. MED134]
MIKIYHNPRCTKSRQGLALLEESGKEFEIVKYLDTSLSTEQLNEIINILDIKPIELVRKNEAIWKSDYKGKDLTDAQIVAAMIENPKLIERPIVILDKNGVIGRPTELINELLEK